MMMMSMMMRLGGVMNLFHYWDSNCLLLVVSHWKMEMEKVMS